jgi:hypothetical protein
MNRTTRHTYLHAYWINDRQVWYAHDRIVPGDGCDKIDVYRISYRAELHTEARLDAKTCENLVVDSIPMVGTTNQLISGTKIRVMNHNGRTYTATVAESEPEHDHKILCKRQGMFIMVKLKYGIRVI